MLPRQVLLKKCSSNLNKRFSAFQRCQRRLNWPYQTGYLAKTPGTYLLIDGHERHQLYFRLRPRVGRPRKLYKQPIDNDADGYLSATPTPSQRNIYYPAVVRSLPCHHQRWHIMLGVVISSSTPFSKRGGNGEREKISSNCLPSCSGCDKLPEKQDMRLQFGTASEVRVPTPEPQIIGASCTYQMPNFPVGHPFLQLNVPSFRDFRAGFLAYWGGKRTRLWGTSAKVLPD